MEFAKKKKAARMEFLDWARGFAAVMMLHGHVSHSFTNVKLQEQSHFVLSQFIGGFPPAAFLFLTGVTLAFLMDGAERQQMSPMHRLFKALRRAGYLWVMAFLFRLQLYLFGWGQTSVDDLFTVDILNCMGLALTFHSFLIFIPGAARGRAALIIGLAITFLAPLVTNLSWQWPSEHLMHYFVPDARFFTFFPWAAYVSFGIAGGTALRLSAPEKMPWLVAWAALIGTPLIFGSQYFSNLPFSLYSNSNFWVDGPGLVLIKTGICLLLIAAAYLWTSTFPLGTWSWVSQIGKASMAVYWVHIEFVYGRWFGPWKGTLSVVETEVFFVAMACLMLSLSVMKAQFYDPLDLKSLFTASSEKSHQRIAGRSAPEPLQ